MPQYHIILSFISQRPSRGSYGKRFAVTAEISAKKKNTAHLNKLKVINLHTGCHRLDEVQTGLYICTLSTRL